MFSLSPQWCLFTGLLLSFAFQNRVKNNAKLWSSKLLQISIILLGAALNFSSVLNQGLQGIVVTFLSIIVVFGLGYIGTKLFRLEEKLGTLITMGTAICGGSAIGALAPVIAAETTTIAISLSIVFLLNSAAVFLFPWIGHLFALSQADFGLWSALAIHDTSSVVASSSVYGKEALTIATTVKLTRALWIIPITLFFSALNHKQDKKITYPWFIAGFVGMSLLFTFAQVLHPYKDSLVSVSKLGFSVTLFLIGLTFDYRKFREVGFAPVVFGTLLWVLVSVSTFFYVWRF